MNILVEELPPVGEGKAFVVTAIIEVIATLH